MYCIKCGVELSDSESKCPLCHTPVYYPGYEPKEERPYPKFEKPEAVNPRGIYFIISFVCIIGAVISFICDLNLGRGVTWTGYAVGGILVFYTIFILPAWFKKYNPAIFIPSAFLAIGAYLAHINYTTGGRWFLTFALPVAGAVTLILTATTTLIYYLRRGYLYIFGGAFILTGIFCPGVETLAIVTFDKVALGWSYYPLISLSLIGIMLIIIAIVKPLRESLCRIFAI